MSGETIESLADIWPMQAELNKRAGFDTAALGEALRAAETGGTLSDEGGLRTEIGRALKTSGCLADSGTSPLVRS